MDEEVFKPKQFAGKWYVHATDTGWMGPYYDDIEDCIADCDHRNYGKKRGPGNRFTENQRMQVYGY